MSPEGNPPVGVSFYFASPNLELQLPDGPVSLRPPQQCGFRGVCVRARAWVRAHLFPPGPLGQPDSGGENGTWVWLLQ